MNKTELIEFIVTKERDAVLCTKIVDATFKLLNKKVSLDSSLDIDSIGLIGIHERKGANSEIPNALGTYSQNNLSIFFHPSKSIQKKVSHLVEEDE